VRIGCHANRRLPSCAPPPLTQPLLIAIIEASSSSSAACNPASGSMCAASSSQPSSLPRAEQRTVNQQSGRHMTVSESRLRHVGLTKLPCPRPETNADG
jgi:hypothetical protein